MKRPATFRFVLSLALVASALPACGGRFDAGGTHGDPTATPEPGGPAASAPITPPLPSPDVTLSADATTPALVDLPATSAERSGRCVQRPGDALPSSKTVETAWHVDRDGHRPLASGVLVGDHRFASVVGALDGDLYVGTSTGVLDDRCGLVRVSLASGASSEVAPLEAGACMRHRALSYAGALWAVRKGAFVRIAQGALSEVATDVGSEAHVVRAAAGLAVVDGDLVRSLRRVDGSLTPRAKGVVVSSRLFDVHPDGTVVYAEDRTLLRSDRREPLVVASSSIASVRVDEVTGSIAFSVGSRPSLGPALSSLFLLDGAGLRHVLSSVRPQPAPLERSIEVFRSYGGKALFTAACADHPVEPSRMPVSLDLATGAVEYLVDRPAWPFVQENALALETRESYDLGWLDDARSGVAFFVRW
jgi:hypothetical protein